jgi:hypothetical protein
MRARLALVAFGAALAVGAAGCGSSGGGQANAGGVGGSAPTTSAPMTSSSAPKAPPVTEPLSVEHFVEHPCDVLTSEQAEALGATGPGDPSNAGKRQSTGPACDWSNTQALTGFGASLLPKDKDGLTDIYRLNQKPGYFGYFKPTTIKGYPGVFDGPKGDRATGTCRLDFAVNDHIVLSALYQGSKETKQPCAKAKRIAADMITTIKESS